MTKPLLILDVSCLAYRALYSTGALSHEGVGTGVIYGVLRDTVSLMEEHATDRIAFCFDGGYAKRLEVFGGYKAGRKPDRDNPMEMELAKARWEVRRQLGRLRKHYLPRIGFRNIFRREGYEADDVIASLCGLIAADDEAVVVSTDDDLLQLIRLPIPMLGQGRVLVWNPATKRPTTFDSFRREKGIRPEQWALVKAIAGCASDCVPGVKGVGEKTAIKYLVGKLKETTKAWAKIEGSSELIERNMRLVQLPFPGVGEFDLREDEVTDENWRRVLKKLGIKSLGRKR